MDGTDEPGEVGGIVEPAPRYGELLRIWEANYGREGGWTVERGGEVVAILTGFHWDDLFWDSYDVRVVAADAGLRERLSTPGFWATREAYQLAFRSREFGRMVPHVLPSGSPHLGADRIAFRGLYLPVRPPRPWDELLMMWRRRRRRSRPG